MAVVVVFTNAFAEDGVTVDKILLGQSCAMSGPAKDLGTKMRAGLLAYFGKANNEGGINGRKISLISKDDGYEPDRAIANTRNLIAAVANTGTFDLGGVTLSFDPHDHQGMDEVFLTIIKGGEIKPL